jgi:hypothetical protein
MHVGQPIPCPRRRPLSAVFRIDDRRPIRHLALVGRPNMSFIACDQGGGYDEAATPSSQGSGGDVRAA